MPTKKKKQKFSAPNGCSLKNFQQLAGNINREDTSDKRNSKVRVKKIIIKQVYHAFITNPSFLKKNSEEQKTILENLKGIITQAVKFESESDKNNIMKFCKRLLGIKSRVRNTLNRIQKKLHEVSKKAKNGEEDEYYDLFRVKGGTQFLKKFLLDLSGTGSISQALGDMDIEDFSREEVEEFEDALNNFLDDVDKNIDKIIGYNPLLKVKNDVNDILNELINHKEKKYEVKKLTFSDEDLMKAKDEINKSIINDWKDEYSAVCDKLLTLETERKATRFVRKAVRNVAWFGNRLFSFINVLGIGK